MKSGIDFSELDAFIAKAEITKTQYNDFIYRFLVDMGELIIGKAKDKTPVDTGALRASWGLRTQKTVPHKVMLYSAYQGRPIEKTLYLRDGSVTRAGTARGKEMGVTLSNPQDYATQIENGFVKNNGDWYSGRHMLKNAIEEVKPRLPLYYEIYFSDFKRRNGLEG